MKQVLLTIWGLLMAAAPSWAQEAQVALSAQPALLAPAARPGGLVPAAQAARPAYFIDGYHGGIYGHIPLWQTRFMLDKLHQYPGWKINLELEPESWDTIEKNDKAAYDEFAVMLADQSPNGRIEYINPAYAQSYMYDISGESIIRQFYYGMRKLHTHFPGMVFTTYSSEEPCFTSALPQILLSYGFKYASLKNPNTCWGGYTRAYGGELVNWIGPDGSKLIAVPRYAVEALKPKSTWETIASNNSVAYVTRAFRAGIAHPVGMCIQDAGWAYGPWIKPGKEHVPGTAGETDDVGTPYMPTVFETWRGYIENQSVRIPDHDWHFSQEDVLVSLVWGGQVLQRIAREVRAAENKIVATEKLASMAAVYGSEPWPGTSLDEAWRTLLLSQHHDCWIVPYNENNLRKGGTWADDVVKWTGNTNIRCDSILERSMSLLDESPGSPIRSVRVFNTTAADRDECVVFTLPAGWKSATILDEHHRVVASQAAVDNARASHDARASDSTRASDSVQWLFQARVPSLGYATYFLKEGNAPASTGAHAIIQKDGACLIETDLYSLLLDPSLGGSIRSLKAKRLNDKEFADPSGRFAFNELRGNFYRKGGFHSSTEIPAQVRILENGPLRVRVEIRGQIVGSPFIQVLTLAQGQKRIDVHLAIDWAGNTGIGESPDSVKGYPLKKAFYNDSFKLQALFPLKLDNQKIYKNAPFDVLESRLPNTFFDRWDSIKNVVLLNWVDVTDGADKYGMALLSDHTTSYAHGPHYPLGLTIQYSGDGLFYRNYTIQGPSEVNYALIPHAGRWDRAGIWTEGTKWNEPLRAWVSEAAQPFPGSPVSPHSASSRSLLHMNMPGWEVSSMIFSGKNLSVRLFNAEGEGSARRIYVGFAAGSASLVNLNGQVIQSLALMKDSSGKSYVTLSMPRFGIRTIQFIQVSMPSTTH